MLRTISGLAPPPSGEVPSTARASTARPQIVERGIAHSPEGRHIFPPLTVQENLQLGAFIRHDGPTQQDIAEAYDAVPSTR